MNILMRRFFSNDTDTLGLMFIDSRFACFTLEDAYHEQKIYGKTRIPAGAYLLEVRNSPKFKRPMIYLVDVPNYIDVMIHMGNKSEDTDGCILVGNLCHFNNQQADMIQESNLALDRIQPVIMEAIKKGDQVVLEIRDEDL